MKVTVICTTYNHKKYIRDALEGFINQKTNFEFRVIVHDDASTDGTAEIVEEYACKYPDIIVPILQKENQYSKGIKIISEFIEPLIDSEYVASCEGDDYWCNDTKLQQQVDFLDRHKDCVACVHNTRVLDYFNNNSYDMYPHVGNHNIEFSNVIKKGGASYQTSSLIYRSCYLHNRPDFFSCAKNYSDYPLAMYLALSGRIWFIDSTMSVYRFGVEGSYTRRGSKDLRKCLEAPRSRIELLRAVDIYSERKYKEIIEKVILENEYEIEEMSENFSALKQKKFAEIYNTKPIKYKMKLLFKKHFNWLYHIMRNIKYN